jgi:hypothetical protein
LGHHRHGLVLRLFFASPGPSCCYSRTIRYLYSLAIPQPCARPAAGLLSFFATQFCRNPLSWFGRMRQRIFAFSEPSRAALLCFIYNKGNIFWRLTLGWLRSLVQACSSRVPSLSPSDKDRSSFVPEEFF